MDAWPSAVRDPRIDTLRGLFLVVMMVDHLPQHPLLHFTVQSFGFVSAAEGFVFVSGFVCAWVYGRILVKDGEAALRRRAWHRARDIYLTLLVLYTLVLLGGLWGGRQIASRFPDFWTGWWHGALLIFQPPFFGILPMYVVFLLLTPFLLEQMTRGRTLLIGSASVVACRAADLPTAVFRHPPHVRRVPAADPVPARADDEGPHPADRVGQRGAVAGGAMGGRKSGAQS